VRAINSLLVFVSIECSWVLVGFVGATSGGERRSQSPVHVALVNEGRKLVESGELQIRAQYGLLHR
jgi:hypothetical protein